MRVAMESRELRGLPSTGRTRLNISSFLSAACCSEPSRSISTGASPLQFWLGVSASRTARFCFVRSTTAKYVGKVKMDWSCLLFVIGVSDSMSTCGRLPDRMGSSLPKRTNASPRSFFLSTWAVLMQVLFPNHPQPTTIQLTTWL